MSFVGLLAVTVVALGCTSKTSSTRRPSRSVGGPGRSSATEPLGDVRYDDLVREMRETGGAGLRGRHAQVDDAEDYRGDQERHGLRGRRPRLKPKVARPPIRSPSTTCRKNIGVDLCYQAGRLAESNGNAAAAIQQYERGLKENPKHMPTLISLARLYDRQDEFDKAEKLYRCALEAEPDNAMAHNDLGLCLARHKQSEAALAELRTAVKLEPNRKLYRNNLATVLVDIGRVDEAWNELNTAHPAAMAHYNLGYCCTTRATSRGPTRNSCWPNKRTRRWPPPNKCSTNWTRRPRGGRTQVAMVPQAPPAEPAPQAATAPRASYDTSGRYAASGSDDACRKPQSGQQGHGPD